MCLGTVQIINRFDNPVVLSVIYWKANSTQIIVFVVDSDGSFDWSVTESDEDVGIKMSDKEKKKGNIFLLKGEQHKKMKFS